MKKTTAVEILQTRIEKTTYRCEEQGCEYTIDSEESAARHTAIQHSPTKLERRGSVSLMWFETEEKMDSFGQAQRMTYSKSRSKWFGRGWYASQIADVHDLIYTDIIPAERVVHQKRCLADQLLADARAISDFIRGDDNV